MDNSPIFSNSQKRTGISWGKTGLFAGFIAAGSIILYILIIGFLLAGVVIGSISLLIIVLNVLGRIAMFSSLTGIVLSIIGIAKKKANSIAAIALNIVLVILIVSNAFVSIRPDERGVVISALQPMGYRSDVLEPGLHLILPIVESPRVYSVAPQTYIISSSSNSGDDPIMVRTSDKQDFTISLTVTYSSDPEKVVELHVVWQNRYQDNFVRPLVRAFVRDIASKYTASEIIGSAKKDMEQSALEDLASEFSDNDLILIDFKITNVTR